MAILRDKKCLRVLATLLPLAAYLVLALPTIFLWQHPRMPSHANHEQMDTFFEESRRSANLMMFVVGGIMIASGIGASALKRAADKLPDEAKPTEKVTVQIDARWMRIVRSPFFIVVAALQGVACTFCPLFLYWSGKGMFPGQAPIIVPFCFAVIYVVSFFYLALGGAVIAELYKRSNLPPP